MRREWRWLPPLVAALLGACAGQPAEESAARKAVSPVDETAMLPVLGYLQLLQRLSPPELARERKVLTMVRQTPSTHVRQAMLLAQSRGTADLTRAIALLDGVLKTNAPESVSLHPLARALAQQYQERLKLEQEKQKLEFQNEKLTQQLKDSQRRGDEIQEKLDAMANIEHSIPLRSKLGGKPAASPR